MEITVERASANIEKPETQALGTLKTVRVAVYARVSTDMEIQLHSLEEQMLPDKNRSAPRLDTGGCLC